MDHLGGYVVGGLALLLTLGGCAENEAVCGEGEQHVEQAGAQVCVAENALVIEGGFECSSRASFRYELGDSVLCSTRPLDRRSLDDVCAQLELGCASGPEPDRNMLPDPVFAEPGEPGPREPGPEPEPEPDASAPPDPSEPPEPAILHASCSNALPSELPPPPDVPRGAGGRPKFDEWRDIDCDEAGATASLCSEWSESSPDECGSCLRSPEETEGVCASFDIDVWCDGEGEVLSLAPGCFTCAPLAAHARACCEGLDVDCREWPYPADGKPGMVCAEHSDCEHGLLCGEPAQGSGYGLCHCPGSELAALSPSCQIDRR